MLPHRSLAAFALLALPLAPLAAQQGAPDSSGAVVIGTVYDSVGARALPGAIVQLVSSARRGAAFTAESDADGMFRIPGVPRDRYLIGFLHPALDSLGLSAPVRSLDVRGDSALHVALALPSAGSIHSLLCDRKDAKDSTGMVIGFVRDADTGAPLAGSRVIVMWRELVIGKDGLRQEQRQLPAKTSDEGWFAICGLPTDVALAARAESGKRASGYIELEVPLRGLLHRDFGIPGDSAAVALADTGDARMPDTPRSGTAQLTGVVRGPNGKPLSGAHVVAWGSGTSTTTDDDGSFTLAALPAGTQTVEARYVGFHPSRAAVDLASGRTRNVNITLSDRVTTLDAVQVIGRQSRTSANLNGFLERRQMGLGRFITAEDIDKREPMYFSDLLFTVPGVRVVPKGPFGSNTIEMRGGCTPTIYLDRIQLINADDLDFLVHPRDIVGVEIYQTSTTPAEFHSSTGCGSIVIWTGIRRR
jgi:hypothetical protein